MVVTERVSSLGEAELYCGPTVAPTSLAVGKLRPDTGREGSPALHSHSQTATSSFYCQYRASSSGPLGELILVKCERLKGAQIIIIHLFDSGDYNTVQDMPGALEYVINTTQPRNLR